MDYAGKYLENQVNTSNPLKLTIILYEDLLKKFTYIEENFNQHDLESFESDQALEKLDKAERIVEELYMGISHLSEGPFPRIASDYKRVVDGLLQFKETYNMNIIKGAAITIRKLKEAYEGVMEKGE